MSGFGDDPFGDSSIDNPFADPSIQQVARNPNNTTQGLDDYHPFDKDTSTVPTGTLTNQSAIMQPTASPPVYTKSAQESSMQAKFEELERKQAEVERKAQELDRRERALMDGAYNVRLNNWPPVPSQCPFQPCFYHDIEVEIPLEFQKVVRRLYYMWMFHAGLMIGNVFGGMLLLLHSGEIGVFLMGAIYSAIFIPVSFLCWYRPAYKAFRNDSSFNFMVFFLTFSVQFAISAIEFLGTKNSGFCGLITAISTFGQSPTGVLVGIYLFALTAGFGLSALLDVLLITKIHSLYRSSGASMAKAQAEFTTEFMRNQHVQSAATNVASAAVQQQVNNMNRY